MLFVEIIYQNKLWPKSSFINSTENICIYLTIFKEIHIEKKKFNGITNTVYI